MTTTRESDKAGQGRAITREDEERVREVVARACGVHPTSVVFIFGEDTISDIRLCHQGTTTRVIASGRELQALARAGIVPGPEGWCWAPHPGPLTDLVFAALPADGAGLFLGDVIERLPAEHMASTFIDVPAAVRGALDELVRRGDVRQVSGCYARVVEGQAPPAWLTAAVLAALPGDGTPRDLMGIHNQASIAEYPRCRDKVPAVLAHLVSTGEIEAIEGGAQWRRWGVPEGWAWARMAADNGDMLEHDGDIVADVGDDGRWAAFPATPVRSAIEQHEITRGRAETPAAARQAALRACHERGIFGPRPAPTLTTSTPQGAGMGEQVAIAKAIAGAAPTEPPAQPVVAFRHDPDDGPRWHVRLGAYQGPERGNRHLADLDADAIAAAMQAALSGPLGVAARVAALLASPEARDAVAGRCAAPASAALAVLRWCSEPGPGPEPVEEEAPRGWGDVPTLDRVLAGAGVAIVCGEEDGDDGH